MITFKRGAAINAQEDNAKDCTATDNSCTTMYQAVPDCTKAVPERETVRKWYEKQAENSIPERWGWEKVAVFGILLAVTVAAAYYARDAVAVIVCTLLLTAFGLATDPFHLTRRRLSRNSRIIAAGALLPILVIIAAPSLRTIAVAAAFSGVAGIIAYKGNGHWRAAESYRMSRHVLKALQPDKETDNRDACAMAWQADGAREVVAAAAEMGAYQCQEIEWYVRKAAYTIGFSRANLMSRKHERERVEAIQEAQRAKAEAEELRERLEALTDYVKDYDRYKAREKDAEQMAKEGAAAISNLMKAQEEVRRLQAKIKMLEDANEELVKTADNPILAADMAEAETERRLKEALEKGYSVSQTQAYAGVSHRRAQYYLAEHRKKKPEAKQTA